MKRGFSLIELIIVLSVTTVIFSGVLPLIFKTTTMNRQANLKLHAYQAAQRELENLRGSNAATLEGYTFTPNGVPNGTGEVLVETEIGGDDSNLSAVTSRVSYTLQGKNERIELKSYFFGEE